MAGWRCRGYVADSDEEDAESQESHYTPDEILKQAHPNSNDIEHADALKTSDSELNRHDAENEISVCEGGVEGSTGVGLEEKERNNGLSDKHDGQAKAHMGSGRNGRIGRTLSSQDYGEVDELHDGHYKDASAAQHETDLLERPYEPAGPARPTTPLEMWRPLPTRSSTSSSLSDVCEAQYEALHLTNEEPRIQDHPKLTDDAERRIVSIPALVTLPETAAQTPAGSSRAARTLRHRNPIQLHPYAIESEKYKQILQARGVKPLRIAQVEAEVAKMREEDSQNVDYHAEDSQEVGRNGDHDSPRSSSPLRSQNSSSSLVSNVKNMFVFGDDDELPDMDTILHNRLHKYTGNGYKRLKIASASFRMPPGIVRATQRPSAELLANMSNDDDDAMFDAPLSPPQSASQTPSNIRPVLPFLRPNQQSSQAALPTPVTSSEPSRRHNLVISDDESCDAAPHRNSRPVILSDSSVADGTSAEEDSYDQLQRVQRRIRGVLPASWLKLDIKTRQKKAPQHEQGYRSLSPETTEVRRGVARPVPVFVGKSPSLLAAHHKDFVHFDDEGSVSDGDDLQQRPRRDLQIDSGHDDEENFTRDRWGEAAENDQIDAMLPAVERSRYRKKSRKKVQHQTKIVDIDAQPRSPAHEVPSALQHHRNRPATTTENSRKYHAEKPEFRPPMLSILDAPSLKTSTVPRFLRVASRAVRSRSNMGRHSPSRKYFRLATRQDDQDASETLRNWRQGTIMPSASDEFNTRPDRRPLVPRSANNALAPQGVRSQKGLDGIRNSTSRSTLLRQRNPSAKRRNLQSSLDHLVQRQSRETAASKQLIQAIEERPKKRGQLVSSIRKNSDFRPAMLESSSAHGNELLAKAKSPQDSSSTNHIDDESGLPEAVRHLDGDARQKPEYTIARPKTSKPNVQRSIACRTRKRRPKQLDVSISWSGHSSAPTIVNNFPGTMNSQIMPQYLVGDLITGLGPFGTRYSDNFGIGALPVGTCLHGTTFVGSGSFARSLRLGTHSNLVSSRGYALFQVERTYRWGPWNDTVSSELGQLVTWVHEATDGHLTEDREPTSATPDELAISALESIIAYFSDHLSFLDPVDRLSCVQRGATLMARILLEQDVRHIGSAAGTTSALTVPCDTRYIQLSTMKLVLANQIRQLSQHEIVPLQLQEEARTFVHSTAQRIIELATNAGISEFGTWISDFKRCDAAGHILQDPQKSIEAFIVAQHILRQATNSPVDILEMVAFRIPSSTGGGTFDIGLSEESWKQLFTLLPFLELDAKGVLEIGQRFRMPFENWPLVKRLINPVMNASVTNPRGQAPSFNAYCRALFGRCLHLINGWGWRRCETIIGTLFDFFARNGLAHLRNEESHGSPAFLSQLAKSPSVTAQPEDRCIHILLKIIGSAVRHMRSFYSEKKIRDLVWRLMPNHGRSHPKEEAIRQEDLDALRNHHDLLCTLYWASPPSCRPRLGVIRNLVHLESSHQEACHINIRAWSNLINYQLSIDEPLTSLESFAEWHDDFLVQFLRQHSLARTEAEDQVRTLQYAGGLAVSNDLLENTIARNQRQVEAVLSDALVSLKLALSTARSVESAAVLMSKTLAKVFDMFDVGKSQAVKNVIQALDVLLAFLSKSMTTQQSKPREENDDSQDYGDWPAFEEDDELMNAPNDSVKLLLQNFHEPLRRLLSNCFGSDTVPNDDLLLKIVDVWVAVAQVLVTNGARNWNDYFDRFGSESWSSLRDTEQSRKYNAYYLAILVEKEPGLWSKHRPFLLLSWIGSLVERESLLKFQHRLTEGLLNVKCGSPILENLPFWTGASTGRFHVSAVEFSERRLSLISSVLSNMRVSLDEALCNNSHDAAQLRQEYKDMLKYLMATMKHKYQELGSGSNVAGAYVGFVHRVVEFLQQHTSNICPVDRFFTDNGVFPLPATDPTYVVAQLKNYALRLHDPKTPKQVAVFLQSVSERAAVDGQQPYLVGQLQAAMSKVFEDATSTRPTLRSFLVKAILPAYIEMASPATGLPCGWILALPYLRALQEDFTELLLNLDGTSPKSIEAVASILAAFLGSVRRLFGTSIWSTELFQQAEILKLVSACFSTITALLPALDYIVRLSGPTESAVKHIEFFRGFAAYVSAQLQNGDDSHDLARDDIEDQAYVDVRSFATQELRNTLARYWKYDHHEKRYYFLKEGSRREIVVDIGLYEEERAELFEVFGDFFDCLRAMPALSDNDDDDDMDIVTRRNRVSGLGALVL